MKKRGFIRMIGTVFFLAAVFLLCSCTAKAQSAASSETAAKFGAAGLRLLSERVSPRDFSLPALTGETRTLSAFKGNIVFLNFWATWCGPCRDEMPSMEALYDRFKEKGLEILAVNCGESGQEVQAFMTNNGLTFPSILDEDGRVSNSYGIQAIPTTFIIDRDGMIVLRLVGSINWNTPEVHAAMESLLNS